MAKTTFPLMRYDHPSDVKMRLDHSIVRYKNRPVYVHTGSSLCVTVVDLETEAVTENVHSSDPDLDISSPQLGYCNDSPYLFYIQRLPHRQQKQGLHSHVLVTLTESVDTNKNKSQQSQLASNKALARTINNDYPSLNECIKDLNFHPDWIGRAFHRQLALLTTEHPNIFMLKFMAQPLGLFFEKSRFALIRHEYNSKPVKDLLSKFTEVTSLNEEKNAFGPDANT